MVAYLLNILEVIFQYNNSCNKNLINQIAIRIILHKKIEVIILIVIEYFAKDQFFFSNEFYNLGCKIWNLKINLHEILKLQSMWNSRAKLIKAY